jgi:hypothetical protein
VLKEDLDRRAKETSMSAPLDAQVRRLRVCVAAQSVVLVALLVMGFAQAQQQQQQQKFETIDVERINVRERDGTLRVVITSRDRLPGAIVAGKEYVHPRSVAGLLFFNDEGTETGGLTFSGRATDSGHTGSGSFTFDQYNQDQVVGLQYVDEDGVRSTGLTVWDRPDVPISAFLEARDSVLRMPPGAERDSAGWRLQSLMPPAASRLFLGRNRAKAALLNLSDPEGRVRLRLVVDSAGSARIEFLNAEGVVTRRYR